jgi:DNA-binding NtrC family response regulator
MSDGHVRAQVLVVDDERDHAEAMAEALRKPGHVCTIVHSLAAARDEIQHGHFDVIVTDLVMETETAGLDVLALARAEQPHAETIMVTAHGDIPTERRHCRAARTTSSRSRSTSSSSATSCTAPPRP